MKSQRVVALAAIAPHGVELNDFALQRQRFTLAAKAMHDCERDLRAGLALELLHLASSSVILSKFDLPRDLDRHNRVAGLRSNRPDRPGCRPAG